MNLLELDGQYICCTIKGAYCVALIKVVDEPPLKAVYLLQNSREGVPCKERGEFKYSFFAGYGSVKAAENCGVDDIRLATTEIAQ